MDEANKEHERGEAEHNREQNNRRALHSNENKLSDRRERAWLELKLLQSSQR